jgi:zinc protease
LIQRDQLATQASASVEPREIAGLFHLQATARQGVDLAKVEAAMDEEFQRFLKDGPTAEEVERVKTRYFANFVRGIEGVGGFGGKSDVLAQGQVFAGDPGAFRKTLDLVNKATPALLRDAARRWLSDGVYALEVLPYPELKETGTDADRKKMPEPGAPPSFRMPTVQRLTLSNGLKVVLAERHEVPIVNMGLLIDSGYASDAQSVPGTAKLAMAMLQEGTKTRSSLELAEAIDALGARLSSTAGIDFASVTLSTLKAKLNESMTLYADAILNPAFPAADFERQKRQLLATIQNEKNQATQTAYRVLPKILFGAGHPYGNPMTGSGTEASVNSITRESLEKFHQTWFKPNNATLVVAGDVTAAELQPVVERLFGAWQRGDVPRKNITTVPHQTKPQVYLVDRPGAPQSTIVTGEVAPPRNTPDDLAIEAMNNVLGGSFGSRVNQNLREDKHWSYGSNTLIRATTGQRVFMTVAPVQTDKTKESMSEVNKEMRGIVRGKPVTAEELAATKDELTLSLPGSRESSEDVMAALSEIARFGLAPDYFETYGPKIRALTLADISAAAERVVRPDNLVWVVVGDRAKIEAGVRELNLGELHIVDADGNPVK